VEAAFIPFAFIVVISLSHAYQTRFWRLDRLADLDEAMYFNEVADRLLLSPRFLESASMHAVALVKQLQRFTDIARTAKFIHLEHQALTSSPAPDVTRVASLLKLARLHEDQSELALGRVEDMDLAIHYYEEAVDIAKDCLSSDNSSRARILESLAKAHHKLWRSRSDTRLYPFITRLQECLALADDPAYRLPRLGELAAMMVERFEKSSKLIDLVATVETLNDLLGLASEADDLHLRIPINLLGISIVRTVSNVACDDDLDTTVNCYLQLGRLATGTGDIDVAHDAHLCILVCLNKGFERAVSVPMSLDRLNQIILLQELVLTVLPDHVEYIPHREIIQQLGRSYEARFRATYDWLDINLSLKFYDEALNSAIYLAKDETAQVINALTHLQMIYLQRFDHRYDSYDLDKALFYSQAAVWLTPVDDPLYPSRLSASGQAYLLKFQYTDNVNDSDEAVSRISDSIRHLPNGSDAHVEHLHCLAKAWTYRVQSSNQLADAQEAVERWCEVVRYTPMNSPAKAVRLWNLGKSSHVSFRIDGQVSHIHNAIRFYRQALQQHFPVLSEHLDCIASLAEALLDRALYVDPADIEEAVECYRTIIKSTSQESPGYEKRIHDFVTEFLFRFAAFDTKYSETCMNHLERALQQIGADQSDPFCHCARTTLGEVFRLHFGQSAEAAHIDLAISFHHTALDLCQVNDNKAFVLTLLGNALRDRYLRFKQLPDLNLAVQYQREAVEITSIQSIRYINRLFSLVETLFVLYLERNHSADIDAVIDYWHKALAAFPSKPDFSRLLTLRLAQAHRLRYFQLRQSSDLSLALDYFKKAFDLPPGKLSHRGTYLTQMGEALEDCFGLTGHDCDLDEALVYHNRALNSLGTNSPYRGEALSAFGFTLSKKFTHSGRPSDRDDAVSVLRQCLSMSSTEPWRRFAAAAKWTALFSTASSSRSDLELALEGHAHVLSLLQELVWIGFDATKRLGLFDKIPDSKGLVGEAVACALRLSELDSERSHHYLEQAVELSNWGRSLVWSQSAQFQTGSMALEGIDEVLVQEMQRVGRALQQYNFSEGDIAQHSEKAGQLHRRLAEKWADLVMRVRNTTRIEYFTSHTPFAQLRQSAAGGNVVMINTSKSRCDAVIIPLDGPMRLVPLSELYLDRVSHLASHLLIDYLPSMGRHIRRRTIPERDPEQPLLDCLYELWETIGEPILKNMDVLLTDARPVRSGHELCRIRWCLTGPLVFLPLHAAQPRPDPLMNLSASTHIPGMMELVISSYLPSMSAVVRTQKRDRTPSEFHMLVVAMPKHGLPFADREMDILRSQSISDRVTILSNSAATISNVTAGLKQAAWSHFACHAHQNVVEPMGSAFILENGELPLWQISKEALVDAEFAMSLACETAKGSINHPDEAVHLAAGLQFSGFRSVVATLWSVMDEDGPMIAEQVYRHLFRNWPDRPDSSEAAYALHQAVVYIRDTLHRSPLRWVPFVHFGI
jgi:tetratricopeptide (TPR) repeat protein